MPFRYHRADADDDAAQVRKVFTTPQDAEAAFYDALTRSDLDAMMEVWSEEDDIVCVHPGGPRLQGYDQVRASWAGMFGGNVRLRVAIEAPTHLQSGMISIHSVHELITVGTEARPRQPVVATNIYMRTSRGWRMVVHHASPAPSVPQRAAAEGPVILH